MPRRLFIGGPWDGRVEDVPADLPGWKVPIVGGGVAVYLPTTFGAGGYVVTLFVNGAPTTERLFRALLKAAGLEADQ